MNSRNQEIGKRLRQERNRLGLTQTEMAKRGGVGFSTLCSYENGDSSPKAEALQQWSEYGVDVLYVITGSQGTGGIMSPDEMMILGAWRDSPDELRAAILGFYRAYGSAIRQEDV
ncbi:helix-turn-helix domain-containing protein [Craterilacuibacter sinensis]|uniref:Helix-turn-helix domain-containing protein n=1 Tax=Craterilacuibacter sinensis TaxID=2686017 RepID=A0A845BRH2_9NEIS|nr:helix-turn-helix transcriptional regulator [Craterilacuibacter sinensis]MXR38000.1 helix-turn-helix domain-containing protein [Craterilacuibacter sinensis]